MLEIRNINKKYVTGSLTQTALDEVSLNFRDNEFVAVLGPSGSGKTTLLNIVGGLDRYDSGDLIINGISTKKYKDRDWDSYRNHTIGFVFQSYNLIPHQSILSNVELALTISGISHRERRKRAAEALEKVGLGDQLHKRPNQMSGGQMQRVAIARALINNPDILLADEPTGALDSETSVQVMDLLKEVAEDRLVIMVTHNPELAETYANRVVQLRDGKVIGDSNPFQVNQKDREKPRHENMGKASMSFFTALSLSFNNLRTKKGRTFLTAFAGSIGIIGIALILSLSNGVNTYIEDIQRETMTSYPVTIESQTIDLSSVMGSGSQMGQVREEVGHDLKGVYSNSARLEMANQMITSVTENNLTNFKDYLDDPNSEIQQYLGESKVIYSYDVPFRVYARRPEGTLIDTDTNAFGPNARSGGGGEGMTMGMPGMMENGGGNFMSGMFSGGSFQEMRPGKGEDLVSSVTKDSYDMIAGEWPGNYDEVVLVTNQYNEIPTTALYSLGLLPEEAYDEILETIGEEEDFEIETYSWTFEDLLGMNFYLVPASDRYVAEEDGRFVQLGNDQLSLEELVETAVPLTVSGVIRPVEDAANADLTGAVGYTSALTYHVMDYSNESPVVRAQRDQPETSVLNGMKFAPEDDASKVQDAKAYIPALGISEKAVIWKSVSSLSSDPQVLASLQTMDEVQLAGAMDQFMQAPDDETLLMIYENYISPGSYEENLESFGYVSLDAPDAINIYVDSFEDKESVSACITNYNETVSEEDQITYTDFIALMTSSITTIIDVISYVLIAFVAVSLVVSSIMIGIITYISVLERTKEIGILRAIGASKHNVSQVFNAETFIVGLLAGLIGVGFSSLLLIPGNALIHRLVGSNDVNAKLPLISAAILTLLSVILTLLGGLVPAKKAARKDPVTALRSE